MRISGAVITTMRMCVRHREGLAGPILALRPMSAKFLPIYMGVLSKILHRSENRLQLLKIFGNAPEIDEAHRKSLPCPRP
jgi:hypothetical protein